MARDSFPYVIRNSPEKSLGCSRLILILAGKLYYVVNVVSIVVALVQHMKNFCPQKLLLVFFIIQEGVLPDFSLYSESTSTID